MKEIRLSSKLTKVGLYLGALLMFATIPVMSKIISEADEFHFGMLIAGALFLVMIGFLIYLFKFVASAKIENNKLIFTKQFRSPEVYAFDQIGEITSFRLKSAKYTIVKMKNRHRTEDKYVIINSKSLLFRDKVDAEDELKKLKLYKN